MEEIEQENNNNNQDLIDGLVELVEFLEQHPGLPKKYCHIDLDYYFFDSEKTQLQDAMNMLGSYKKDYTEYYFRAIKTFGKEQRVRIVLTSSRDSICKKVVIRQELQEIEEDVPLSTEDEDALSRLLEMRKKKVQKLVDITAWECPQII